MRMRRTMSGLVGTAMLGLVPPTPALAASAPHAHVVMIRAVNQGAAGDLPEREVSSRIVETSRHELILKGNVSPGHAKAPVHIQKRNCLRASCTWYRFTTVQTNEKGGYSAPVTAPRKGYDYWRAKVTAHGGYATSFSEAWRTYTS